MFVKFGKEIMMMPNRKSDTSNFLSISAATVPVARSFIEYAKSPHISHRNSTASPPAV